MPTRAGVLVLLIGLTAVTVGRVLGYLEIFLLGIVALALLAVCWLYVRFRRLSLQVSRTISPGRVPAGAPARVELQLVNRARRATPVLRIHDGVSGTRGARLSVAPLAKGATSTAAYRLPTDKRGVVDVGPLDIELTDPFGLTRGRIRSAPKAELLVHPPVYPVRALPEPDGQDQSLATDEQLAPVHQSGDEFHALRPYVSGDDLRRVHWASSARHDQLMVRQDEQIRQGRLTVVLDNRAEISVDALDALASIAASLLVAANQRQQATRLLLADGTDSEFGAGTLHVDTLLRSLALANPTGLRHLPAQLEPALTDVAYTSIVVVATQLGSADLEAVKMAGQRVRSLTLVHVEPSAYDPAEPDSGPHPAAAISVTRNLPFPQVWDRYHLSSRLVGRPS
ncbi:MAG: DUF58 domain-containing protein [Acidimicrobiales bacterium]|nr:DUF58 domain-containing protein [Acidimicrobiales bacterium]